MPTDKTPNLQLPYIYTNQAQKEVNVNEAFAIIDSILNAGVISRVVATPPASPLTGDAYIVASSPTGVWAGKTNNIAYYNNGWKFVAPKEGLQIWVNNEDIFCVYNGSSWIVASGIIPNGDKGDVVVSGNGSSWVIDTGVVTAAKLASSLDLSSKTVSLASINSDQLGACKNKLINGSFDIWQEGAPITATTTGKYGPDQWRVEGDGTGWTRTFTKTAYSGALESAMSTRFYLTLACTVAGTGATYSNLVQYIECANTLHNGQVTISYWINSPSAYTQNILLRQYFGTGGSPSASIDVSTTVSLVAGWNKVVRTLTLPDAINGKTYGTNGDDALIIAISFPVNQTSSFAISNVQLERCSVASKFEVEPFSETLRKCQRYFNKSFSIATVPTTAVGTGQNGNCYTGQITLAGAVTNRFASQFFPVVMRASPTITLYNPINANSQAYDTTAAADCSSTSASSVGERGFFVNATGAAGSAVGNRILLHYTANARY